MLLKAGANAAQIDAHANTPLLLAAQSGHDDIVRLLLPRSDIHHANATGDTALILAARENHLMVVERLLVEKACTDQRNHAGEDAIAAAQAVGNHDVAGVLLRHRAWKQAGSADRIVVQRGKSAVASDGAGVSTSGTPVAFHASLAPSSHAAWSVPGEVQQASPVQTPFVGASMVVPSGIDSTSLEQAVRKGDRFIVDLLLQHGLDPNAALACGETLLTIAVMHGHVEVVSLLLRAGASIDAIGVDGCTPLMLAIVHRQAQVVHLLLHSHPAANVSTSGRDGWTPLMLAAQFQYPEMVRALLDAGADVHAALPEGGWTALMCAAHRGNAAIAMMLLAHGAKADQLRTLPLLIDASMEKAFAPYGRPSDVMSALLHAVGSGSIEVFELLLNYRMRCESARAGDVRDIEAALMFAADAGRADMVTLMMKISPRLSFEQVRHAIVLALIRGKTEVVTVFLAHGFSFDALLGHGLNALQMAMDHGDKEMVETLMRHIAGNPAAEKALAAAKNEALCVEAARGNLGEVQALLNGGASAGYIDANGKTALMLAREYGHEDIVRLLRSHDDDLFGGRSADASANRDGRQAIVGDRPLPENAAAFADTPDPVASGVASVANAAESVQTADPAGVAIAAAARPEKDEERAGRFSKVARAGMARMRKRITKAEKEARLATAKAAQAYQDAYPADTDGTSALMLAIQTGALDVMRFLLKRCNKGSIAGPVGAKALAIAASVGNVDAISLLLAEGAPIDSTESGGSTPLMTAVECGQRLAMRALLDAKANVNAAGTHHYTALLYAVHCNQPEMVRDLLEAGAALDIEGPGNVGPLLLAAWKNFVKVAEVLIAYGADVGRLSLRPQMSDGGDVSGAAAAHVLHNGALCRAAQQGSVEMLELLLNHWKAPDSDEAQYREQVAEAAVLAALGGHMAAFQLLVKRRPEISLQHIVHCVDLAAEAGRAEMAQVLFDGAHGWDDVLSNGGRLLFLKSAESGRERVVRLFLEHAPVKHDDASFLLMLTKALFIAVEADNSEIAGMLLKAGADVKGSDESGVPVIYHAIAWGYEDMLALLLDHGADPDQRTGKASGFSSTPLIEAVKRDKRAIVELLLRRGANRFLLDQDERTAQAYASLLNNEELIELLKKADASDEALHGSTVPAPATPDDQ
jgi:ankyrin repeat protein